MCHLDNITKLEKDAVDEKFLVEDAQQHDSDPQPESDQAEHGPLELGQADHQSYDLVQPDHLPHPPLEEVKDTKYLSRLQVRWCTLLLIRSKPIWAFLGFVYNLCKCREARNLASLHKARHQAFIDGLYL